jgi:trk system potassium uptake protein TrkH
MNRVAPILHALGLVIMLFAGTMAVPLAVSVLTGDGAQLAYDEGFGLTLFTGAALWLATRGRRGELQLRDGFLLVALTWAILPAFATLPLLLYLPEMSFTDAYFEAVSGLTATGATVMSGLDALPASINIWRGLLQWLGGIGVLVLAVAVLPMLGVGGRQMFKAETPGPMKENKLTPRITESAKGLWLIYAGLTALCFTAYWAAGMGWTDALMHSFTTLALSGFSSHDASFGYFDSPLLEAIAATFMLIAGINFATHFVVLRRGTLRPYAADPEAWAFVGLMAMSVGMVTLLLWLGGTHPDAATAFRYALFNTISVATTTGYANTDYNLWPAFLGFWILFLGTFSTSSGSTGGGIKMIRARILYGQLYRELVRLLHPNMVSHVRLGHITVSNDIIFAVLAFFFVFIVCIVTMTLALMASGLDDLTAFSAVVACISNIGPGLGKVGPAATFAVLTDFQTWVCTFAMLLGRLEIFALLLVLTPAFWRK